MESNSYYSGVMCPSLYSKKNTKESFEAPLGLAYPKIYSYWELVTNALDDMSTLLFCSKSLGLVLESGPSSSFIISRTSFPVAHEQISATTAFCEKQ